MSDSAGDESADPADDVRRAVVLDYLAHGRPGDDRPQYEKPSLAYALDERDFGLFELELGDDADVGIGDRVVVDPPDARTQVGRVREVEYEELSNAAHSELEYVVDEVIDDDERRFVDVYNDAQPITLRLHQLNLLPGIGDKLRDNVLDERKRGPFESFEEVAERVDGLHDPRQTVVDRIMEEIRDEDLKYKLFATDRREE